MTATEEQPLLASVSGSREDGVKHTGIILDFDKGDVENPREWPVTYKWAMVSLLALTAFTVTFTCISVVPVAGQIVDELSDHTASPSTSALLVTIWELGEAAGPLLIAPLSEVYGRYPVMNACNVLFILASILAARSESTALFIGARALTGAAVASNVLNPAIIGDIFESEQRGSTLSLVTLAPLIGGAIGPAIGGAIAQTLGWRRVLLIAAALAVACELTFFTCFRETYKMVILKRRIAHMQEDAGQDPIEHTGDVAGNKLWNAIIRPFTVLFGSGVLLALSLFGSVMFSYFYVISTTLPGILLEEYGFTPAQTGTSFICFSVGSFISILICNFSLDRIYIRLCDKDPSNKGHPEYRLPLTIVGGIALPLSVLAYGWIAHFRLPVALLLISVGLMGFNLLMSMVPLSAYVVDACGPYSASALTGVIVSRCLMGTFLPLTAGPLAEKFGYGWAFTLLSLLSLGLAPIPFFVFRYGEKWRQASKFTRGP
ncbi:MFS general substrate transporter [Bimuria novae-zelandiae CBS 107.79]|uniref:MFS general substrate transporter n=1 Tax=Bimuria novae-zelandiae CBS 107.79 TaxID=1447943 RepID=A0A6A5ULA9_9PLEO|nr:MFS general substrate transporter [Bimuria novae-zelandiae CBS 107.79]